MIVWLLGDFYCVIVLGILYVINRKYVKFLNIKVKKKTRKIYKQKEYLKSLLEIYDKNVIFSKTDLKGVITDVSDAFCKISGYSKEELLGKQIIAVVNFPKKQIGNFMSECLVLGSVGDEHDIVLLTSDIRVENGLRIG